MWTPKINAQGFSAKFYLWYTLKYSLPKGYCDFFWTLVLAYVLIIPYIVLSLPAIILGLFSETFKRECINKNVDRILFGLIIYLLLFVLFTLILGVMFVFSKLPAHSYFAELGSIGVLIWVIIIFCFLVWVIEIIYKKIKQRKNIDKVKNGNSVVGTIKAIYKKYCPQIEWYNLKK